MPEAGGLAAAECELDGVLDGRAAAPPPHPATSEKIANMPTARLIRLRIVPPTIPWTACHELAREIVDEPGSSTGPGGALRGRLGITRPFCGQILPRT